MAQKMSVSLEEKHVKIVERYGRKIGVSAFSTALQALIHNFDQAQKAPAVEAPALPATEAAPTEA